MKKYLITANLDYVQGHLRYGHIDLELTEEEFEKYSKLDDYAKNQLIKEYGDLVVDDFEIDDVGDIYEILIKEAEEE